MARLRLYDEPRKGLSLRLPGSFRDERQLAADTRGARGVPVNHLAFRAVGGYLQTHPTITLEDDRRSSKSVAS